MYNWLKALLMAVTLTACSTTSSTPPAQPVPKIVTIKDPSTTSNPSTPVKAVKKNMFNVVVKPDDISANGIKLENLEALNQLLASHDKPVVTLTVHRCVKADVAKDIVTSVQSLTNVPVAYSAFGKYTDKECS